MEGEVLVRWEENLAIECWNPALMAEKMYWGIGNDIEARTVGRFVALKVWPQ